jgi:hypothetical protein
MKRKAESLQEIWDDIKRENIWVTEMRDKEQTLRLSERRKITYRRPTCLTADSQ